MTSPTSCHACTALLLSVRSDRLDCRGQMHLDRVSRLSVDLPDLRSSWFLEEAREVRTYGARGESHILAALRGERTYWRVFYPPDPASGQGAFIGDGGAYDVDLDGDPFAEW